MNPLPIAPQRNFVRGANPDSCVADQWPKFTGRNKSEQMLTMLLGWIPNPIIA
jgi:hypothetical protein